MGRVVRTDFEICDNHGMGDRVNSGFTVQLPSGSDRTRACSGMVKIDRDSFAR